MPDNNNIKSIISALAQGKMSDANTAFNDEMSELINTKLADRKVEIASRMTIRPEDSEEDEVDEIDSSEDDNEV
jgi:hypothetical protein